MDAKQILTIVVVILLIPVGAYLRDQTYRNVHGNATIGRDIESPSRALRSGGGSEHGERN